MATTITNAELLIKSGTSPSTYVRATVEMPAAEWDEFIAPLAGLTDGLTTAPKAYINARIAAGTSSGG